MAHVRQMDGGGALDSKLIEERVSMRTRLGLPAAPFSCRVMAGTNLQQQQSRRHPGFIEDSRGMPDPSFGLVQNLPLRAPAVDIA